MTGKFPAALCREAAANGQLPAQAQTDLMTAYYAAVRTLTKLSSDRATQRGRQTVKAEDVVAVMGALGITVVGATKKTRRGKKVTATQAAPAPVETS